MMTTRLHLTVVYEKDEDGWWVAQVPEVQGIACDSAWTSFAFARASSASGNPKSANTLPLPRVTRSSVNLSSRSQAIFIGLLCGLS